MPLPRGFQESYYLNVEAPDPKTVSGTGEKLRLYRQQKGLLQREVADFAGIERRTYIRYEEGDRDYYQPDILSKIAEILDVDMLELMDDYNLFLYRNQGKQIRAKRKALKMTIPQYAKHLGVTVYKIKRWEGNQVMVHRETWEKYFK